MAKYEKIVTTEAGLELLAAAYSGGTITFTALRTGNGSYTGTENLAALTALKRVRQTFSISSVTRTGSQVKVRSVVNNTDLTEEYSVTEIGLYAKGASGTEVLFAIIVAGAGGGDYLPEYELAPTSITMELYIEITDSDNGATFVAEVIEGAYVSVESFNEHVTDNTIHITAAERSTWNAKLATSGNASNVTVAFTEASTLAAITTGSKLSVLFGTVAKAVKSLISHLANTSNPHSVTKSQVGLGSVDNTSDADKPVSTATQTELDKKALAADLTSHTGNTSNPHSVTKAQVGLGNVPNVATNDQTPSYSVAGTLAALATGEKLNVAFGKIAKAVSDLISHLANKSNPHGVTKAQVGLGSVDNTSDVNKPISTATQTELDKKALTADLTTHTGNTSNPHSVTKAQVGLSNVPNVATNDQTPTYTAASSLTALTSGEKLSVALGKLSKAVSELISHLANSVSHVTAAERTAWNAKADQTAVDNIVSGTTTVGNANKLDGLDSAIFEKVERHKLRTYARIEDINANYSVATPILDIVKAMDMNSILSTSVYSGTGELVGIYPSNNGYYSIFKTNYSNELHIFKDRDTDKIYKGISQSWVGYWSGWTNFADGGNADTLDGYHASSFLSVNGGRVSKPTNAPLEVDNTSGPISVIDYYGMGVYLGAIGFNQEGTPAIFKNGIHPILHTGNSVPIKISDAAPADTTALWVDTTSMKMKVYKSGAWATL